jgi:hypothetical protein
MCPENEEQQERKQRKRGGFSPLTPVLEEFEVTKIHVAYRWSKIEESVEKNLRRFIPRLRR